MRLQQNFRNKKGVTLVVTFLLVILLAIPLAAQNKRPLMRFPDVHGDQIVFTYGGDIWKTSTEGGVAQRLTIHDGEETFPKFSPDGSRIAFSAEYDGNDDVYVMNANGGDIKRLTYHPNGDRVIGWHPVKNKIMFISRRKHFYYTKLYLISPDGTGLEEMIMHNIAQASFSPDGKKLAYNRINREDRTWKRHEGGTAQEVYLYDLETDQETNLTRFKGTDRLPMWIDDKIYFSSDRDRVLNIYSCDPVSGKIEQLTYHTKYDIRRPSMGGNKIIYELAGSLWLLDVTTKETKQIPVRIEADAPEARPYLKDVRDYITGIDCSPSGDRALIVARGEMFTVPEKEGLTYNLTKDSGSREKDAVWSPDGKQIAYLSDKSGEYEIYICDTKGENKTRCLTKHKEGYRHTLRWSPDSKKIAYTDQTLTLYILDVASGKVTHVDRAEFEHVDVPSQDDKPIYDFQWSFDNQYITYSKMNENLLYQIYIYSLDDKTIHCVSNGLFNDFHPVFSADGNHLFFVSRRRFDPSFCDMEWEMIYKQTSGIYCLSLRKNSPSILPFKNDENLENPQSPNSEKGGNGNPIDFEGIADRVESLPLPRGNYRFLSANESSLFYMNKDEGDFNRFAFRDVGAMNLCSYSFVDRKENSVIEQIDRYKLSADGSKIIYQRGSVVGFIAADALGSEGNILDLSDLKMWMDPVAEWKQMYNEAWRQERDYYYEPGMHGQDWVAVKRKYEDLVQYASCRQDIEYIIGEMIGELNSGHTYVYGGDVQRRSENRINTGMLGVDWGIDSKNKRYRFDRILRTPDWTRMILPPLDKPGLNLKNGDYLLKINGEEVTTDRDIYSYFSDQADKQVVLTVNSKPDKTDARDIVVKPLRGENALRYQDWAEQNRKKVEEASNGQIGYIHMPDTFDASGREFPKYFYGQTRKKGIILDGRFNGGGLSPDIFLQRLAKKPRTYWTRRQSHDQTVPFYAIQAHMVCLTNRQAGSGGDELPYEFQHFKMGPVIGTRTWGGLIGYSTPIRVVDGGEITAPDYRIYDENGNWVVENFGVQPDIEIDLHPAEMAKGIDAQLIKGVEILMKKIEEEPINWPKHRPYPVDKP